MWRTNANITDYVFRVQEILSQQCVYSVWSLKSKKYMDGISELWCMHTDMTLPTGQWWNVALRSRRSRKTSRYSRLLWSWVDGVWHQNSSQSQSPINSLQGWDDQKRRWRLVKSIKWNLLWRKSQLQYSIKAEHNFHVHERIFRMLSTG